MFTRITHIKKDRDIVVEVGAIEDGHVTWRAPVSEAIRRYRAGVRYFVQLPDGSYSEVVVEPGGFYTEPLFRTVADRVFDRKLLKLPEFYS